MMLRTLLLSSLLAAFSLAAVAQAPATLKLTKQQIESVQDELHQRGYLKTRATGVVDQKTREALRKYQADNGLPVSGRIDAETMEKLGVGANGSASEPQNQRKPGIVPKIGYAVKDTTTSTTGAVKGAANSAANSAGRTVKAGADKTTETASDVGESSVNGAKAVGRGAQGATRKVSDTLVGRSDADISEDVRRVLAESPATEKVRSRVDSGKVKLTLDGETTPELDKAVTKIRAISGVKSVEITKP
jgi:peptidoglycan hydrolase-like protein with peptidoglycan-binding domain